MTTAGVDSAAAEQSGEDTPAAVGPAVVVLTDQDFNVSVHDGAGGLWFVEFYAPWCGHCKQLTPVWEKLAERLHGVVHVGKVDATVETRLAEEWEIEGFPTLKLIVGDQVYGYSGDRDVESLEAFARGGYKTPAPVAVTEKADSRVVELSYRNFDASVRDNPKRPWFIEFYAPWCGHCKELAPRWEALAEKLSGRVDVGKVDATTEPEIAEQWGARGYPTLMLIAASSVYGYRGPRTVEALEAFADGGYAASAGEPLPPQGPKSAVIRLSTDDFFSSVKGGSPLPWFINFYLPSCGWCKKLAPEWERLAENVQGEMVVAKVDAGGERELAEAWGVERFPTLYVIANRRVYEYTGHRRTEEMQAFAQGGYKNATVLRVLAEEPSILERHHTAVAFGLGSTFAALVAVCWSLWGPQQAADSTSKKEE